MAFGMNDMLADMLRKTIPPEVMQMLTAERLKDIGDKANAFMTDIRERFDRIEAKLDLVLADKENVDGTEPSGSVGNGGGSGSKKRNPNAPTSDVSRS